MPYTIDPDHCASCGQCADVCPVDAIEPIPGGNYAAYHINPALCIECGECEYACPQRAVREVEDA